jgi:Transposase, Mutator family
MTDVGRMSVGELVGKVLAEEHADVLRQAVCWLAEQLMEAEVSQAAGAAYGERNPERAARRNGYRERAWDTRVGSIELAIPRLRQGSYFPSFLEPRRRGEQALVAVVQEADVNGISTRKVDRLVEALGLAGASKDQVSRLCRGLDEQVTAFRQRPLEGRYPYLWLDAKVEKVRAGGRVEHHALVVAYGVDATGQREVIGLDVGAAETEAFWKEFLRGLVRRGLAGVQLVVSDAHEGLKQAIAQVLKLPLAALHRPLPPRRARPLPQGSAAAGRRRDPPHLPGRQPRGGPPPARRDSGPSPRARAQGGPAAVGGRAGPAGLLRLSRGAPLEVAVDQSAGAGQPRDRSAHRRGGRVPQ